MIKMDISDLLCLCDKLSHRVDEQNETIEYYQKEIKRLHQVFDIKDSARAELVKENKKLKSCLTIAENDYKNCYAENIRLSEENNQLKLRNKMLTKIGLNSIYGIHCCKNHCVYTDTDSIKSEMDKT